MEDLLPAEGSKVAEVSEVDHPRWRDRRQAHLRARHHLYCRTDPPCLSASSVHAAHGQSVLSTVWVKKSLPRGFVAIFQKWLGIFWPNFMCLLCVPIYTRLRIFIQLSVTLMKLCQLSVTTQFTSCVQNVRQWPKRTLAFSDILSKQLGVFSLNFTCLLHIHTYARMQFFVQLSPTVTKLCHIKCDHPACVSVVGGHSEHIIVVALNMA